MFRNYDWQCWRCGSVCESVTQFDQGTSPPREALFDCESCGFRIAYVRCISMPAEYHGEKVRNPRVSGGSFDTAGNRELPALPDLPKGVEERSSNYRQMFATAEYKEVKAERAEVQRQNARKRERMRAIDRGGTVNMRRDKLPGDPKWS